MALNGLFPVLLVDLSDALTQQESAELNKLMALQNPNAEQQAMIDKLKMKSQEASGFLGGLARIPIILDGEIIKAQPENYQQTMVKQITLFGDNSIGIKSVANTVTINIVTSSSKTGVSIFPDILYTIADVLASKQDSVARISYFGDNVLIPKGYLTRLSKSSSANSEREVITLEIQKELDIELPGFGDVKEVAEPFKVASDWIAS